VRLGYEAFGRPAKPTPPHGDSEVDVFVISSQGECEAFIRPGEAALHSAAPANGVGTQLRIEPQRSTSFTGISLHAA
jgi:hypothetical protein